MTSTIKMHRVYRLWRMYVVLYLSRYTKDQHGYDTLLGLSVKHEGRTVRFSFCIRPFDLLLAISL